MHLHPSEIEKLQTLMHLLQNDPALAHTAAEAARLVQLSPLRLKQVFKPHTGTTIQQFITAAKMQKAATLIVQHTPIKEVSIIVGYADLTSFYRTFRKHFGCTPVQYKQRTT
jgi:AraC-like DNA-binding protein